MMRKAKTAVLLLLAVALLSLSGCYSGNIDQYFSLPQPTDEFLQLQELIDREITTGSEYASPVGGEYRQSVQLFDLNGDGVNEALAFFRERDKSLKIIVYSADSGSFREVLSLRGEGRAIGSIDYADMDEDGETDLLVAWQVSPGMNTLNAYDLTEWSGDILLGTECTEFLTADMDRDGHSELLILRAAASETYLADMYYIRAGHEYQASSAYLSAGILDFRQFRTVTIQDGSTALLVESTLENGDLATDLLICRDGSLTNLTLNHNTGVSELCRSYTLVSAQDIDGDGHTELPVPSRLYSDTDDVFWTIAWYAYDLSGRAATHAVTYHCFPDSWYLTLPSGWEIGLTVRRDSSVYGEHAVTLSRLGSDGSVNDLLTIYTLTGENRTDRAAIDGRFILREEESTIYACRIELETLQERQVENMFHIIYADWGFGSVYGG